MSLDILLSLSKQIDSFLKTEKYPYIIFFVDKENLKIVPESLVDKFIERSNLFYTKKSDLSELYQTIFSFLKKNQDKSEESRISLLLVFDTSNNYVKSWLLKQLLPINFKYADKVRTSLYTLNFKSILNN